MPLVQDNLIVEARAALRNLGRTFLLRTYEATPEDYERIDDEDFKCEYVDGVLIVHSPASIEHEDVAGFLLMLLRDHASRTRLGRVLGSNAVMQIGEQRFSPDVSFLAVRHESRIRDGRVFGPMDLAVEVLSVSTRSYDRGEKLAAYRAGGVPEIWMVDPEQRVFEAHVLSGDAYNVRTLQQGSFESQALSGFTLRVDWLWQRPLPSLAECAGRAGDRA